MLILTKLRANATMLGNHHLRRHPLKPSYIALAVVDLDEGTEATEAGRGGGI